MNVNGTLIADKMGKGTLLYKLSSRSSLTEDGSDRGADSAAIWLKLVFRKHYYCTFSLELHFFSYWDKIAAWFAPSLENSPLFPVEIAGPFVAESSLDGLNLLALPCEHIFNLLIGSTIVLLTEIITPRVGTHENFGLWFVWFFNFVQFWRRWGPFWLPWYTPVSAAVGALEISGQSRKVALRYKTLEAFELHSKFIKILVFFFG